MPRARAAALFVLAIAVGCGKGGDGSREVHGWIVDGSLSEPTPGTRTFDVSEQGVVTHVRWTHVPPDWLKGRAEVEATGKPDADGVFVATDVRWIQPKYPGVD